MAASIGRTLTMGRKTTFEKTWTKTIGSSEIRQTRNNIPDKQCMNVAVRYAR
jgi:hypothetical protein